MTTHHSIPDRDGKPSEYHVEVKPGSSIRIFGRIKTGQQKSGEEVWLICWQDGPREAFKTWRATLAEGARQEFVSAVRSGMPAAILADWLEERGGNRDWATGVRNELVVRDRWEPTYTDIDRTFGVGDQAEYNSYNLSYYGPILSIGAKTVTIQDTHYEKKSARLTLYGFCVRNWDFDHGKASRRNHDEMLYL